MSTLLQRLFLVIDAALSKIGAPLHRLVGRWEKKGWIRAVFLTFCYLTIAGATFEGFYEKWGFRDRQHRYSFIDMVEGTAHKPFVHRQLLPKIANLVNAAVPPRANEWFVTQTEKHWWWEGTNLLARLRIDPIAERAYVLRYFVVYFISVVSLFLSLFVMRKLCRERGLGDVASTLTPVIFSLTLVYFLSMGGFFYDFPEVFFLFTSFTLALKGPAWAIIPLSALAEYNKESFLFFALTLFPLYKARFSLSKSLAITALSVGASGVTYLLGRAEFRGNPGGTVESWFVESLLFYANPKNLFPLETTFGVLAPRAYSILGLGMLFVLFLRGFGKLSAPLRQHGLLIGVLNNVLVLVFCGPGEMRNFSLCYVIFFLVLAENVASWVQSAAGTETRAALASVPGVSMERPLENQAEKLVS